MNQAREVIQKVFGTEGKNAIHYFESFHQRNQQMPLIINGAQGTGKTKFLKLLSKAFSNGESMIMNYEYSTRAGIKKHIQESDMILIEMDYSSALLTKEVIKDLMQIANGKPIVVAGNFSDEVVCHWKFITLSHEHLSPENRVLINQVLGS